MKNTDSDNRLVSRREKIRKLIPNGPKYRVAQIFDALFNFRFKSWKDISNIPADLKNLLGENVPWLSGEQVKIVESKNSDTFKAVLRSPDGLLYETVLMANKKGYWTICVSSQVGCAMKCTFCATGTMGLKRSLSADEIVDQYRFWKYFLLEKAGGKSGVGKMRISNIVFMGMGEPLANYENVRESLNTILKYTDIGPTKITVSTVGMISRLEKLIEDPLWPPVRLAVSLHSADPARRKEIVPTTISGFHEKLVAWTRSYAKKGGNRKHHVTFEYTLIDGINDGLEHAKKLIKFVQKTAFSKINVIPLNPVPGKSYERSQRSRIEAFKKAVKASSLDIMERRTMGDDIMAACGQLVVDEPNETPRSKLRGIKHMEV